MYWIIQRKMIKKKIEFLSFLDAEMAQVIEFVLRGKAIITSSYIINDMADYVVAIKGTRSSANII